MTPLHHASVAGDAAIVQQLLDAGAAPNAADQQAGTIWLLLLPCICALVSSRVRRSLDPICTGTPPTKKIRDLESDENVELPLLQRNILALHFGILVPTCVLYYHNITHLTSEYLVFDAPCPLENPPVRLVSFDIPSILSIPHVDFPFNFLYSQII